MLPATLSNHAGVRNTFTMALSGALNGAVFDVAARGRLVARGIDLALAGRRGRLQANVELLALAAAMPAVAIGAGLLTLVPGVPVVARTRRKQAARSDRAVASQPRPWPTRCSRCASCWRCSPASCTASRPR